MDFGKEYSTTENLTPRESWFPEWPLTLLSASDARFSKIAITTAPAFLCDKITEGTGGFKGKAKSWGLETWCPGATFPGGQEKLFIWAVWTLVTRPRCAAGFSLWAWQQWIMDEAVWKVTWTSFKGVADLWFTLVISSIKLPIRFKSVAKNIFSVQLFSFLVEYIKLQGKFGTPDFKGGRSKHSNMEKLEWRSGGCLIPKSANSAPMAPSNRALKYCSTCSRGQMQMDSVERPEWEKDSDFENWRYRWFWMIYCSLYFETKAWIMDRWVQNLLFDLLVEDMLEPSFSTTTESGRQSGSQLL